VVDIDGHFILKTPLGLVEKSQAFGSWRPEAVGRGNFPILLVKATPGPLDCPVFGEQIEITTATQEPFPANQGNHPISIVKISFGPVGYPVFGQQIHILTSSPRLKRMAI
jgi:hypothetical protein